MPAFAVMRTPEWHGMERNGSATLKILRTGTEICCGANAQWTSTKERRHEARESAVDLAIHFIRGRV
jgi:hypothetical protein